VTNMTFLYCPSQPTIIPDGRGYQVSWRPPGVCRSVLESDRGLSCFRLNSVYYHILDVWM